MSKRRVGLVFAGVVAVAIVSITCFSFCGAQQPFYWTISVSDARAMMQSSSNPLVVDVRTPQEYAQGHLKGAVNIPLSDLPLRMDGLDHNRPMVVYCQTGVRSAQGSSLLVRAGFAKVFSMEGGISAWINSGYPTVSP